MPKNKSQQKLKLQVARLKDLAQKSSCQIEVKCDFLTISSGSHTSGPLLGVRVTPLQSLDARIKAKKKETTVSIKLALI